MISERTLRQWRKQSLIGLDNFHSRELKVKDDPQAIDASELVIKELNERILRLTQILLDQYLLRKD